MDQKPPAFGASWGIPASNTASLPQQQPAQQAPPTFSFGATGGFGGTQPAVTASATGFGGFGAPAAASAFGGFSTNTNNTTVSNPVAAAAPLTSRPTTAAFSFGSPFGAPATTTQQAPAAFGSSGFSLFGNPATTSTNSAATTAAPALGGGFGAFGGFGSTNAAATNTGPFGGFGATASQPTVAAPVTSAAFSFGQATGTAPSASASGGGVQPSLAPNTGFAGFGSTFTPQATAPTTTSAAPSVFSGFGFGQPTTTSSTSGFGSSFSASTAPSFNFGGSQPAVSAPATVTPATPVFGGFNSGAAPTTNVLTTPSIFGGFSAPTTMSTTTVSAAPATAPVGTTGFSFGGSNAGASAFNFSTQQSTTIPQPFGGFQQQQSHPAPATATTVNEPQKPTIFGIPSTSAAPSLFSSLLQPTASAAPATAPVTSAPTGFSFALPSTSVTTNTTAPAPVPIQQPFPAVASPAVTMQTLLSTPSVSTATTTSGDTTKVPSFSFGTSTIAAPVTAAVQPSSAAVQQQPMPAATVGGFSFGAPKPALTPQAAATTATPSTSGFSFQLPVTTSTATPQPVASSAEIVVPQTAAAALQPPGTSGNASASVIMPTAAPQPSRPTFQFAGAPLAAPSFSSVPSTASAAAAPVVSFTLPPPKPLLTLPAPPSLPAMPQQPVAAPPPVDTTTTGGFVLPASTAASQLIMPAPTVIKPDETKVPVFDAAAFQRPISSQAAPAVVSMPTTTMTTPSTATLTGGIPSLVSPSRAARVSFQLPHSGLVVSPGKNRGATGVPGTSGTAAVVLEEQDRDRLVKMLRSWTWRDLSEFCDLQARELDSVHTETFHAGHIWLLSLQVLREDMQDKLQALIEASKNDYDQAHRLVRELDYIDAELNELEKLIDNGEAIVRERTKQYDERQQFTSSSRYNGTAGNSYYGNSMPANAPAPQLSDYLRELYATVYDACASTYDFTQRFEAVRNAFTSTLFPSSFSSNERHWILEAPHEAQHSSTFSQLILSSIAYAELFRFDRLHHMLRCLEQIQLEYEHLYKSLSERIHPELAVRIAANIERRLRVVEARFRVAEKMGVDDMGLIGGLNNQLNIRTNTNDVLNRYSLPAAGSGGGLDMLPVATTLLSSYRR